MEIISERAKHSPLSGDGEHVVAQYERWLRMEEDLSWASIRNYLSDLRQFIFWHKSLWQQGREEDRSFTPKDELLCSPIHTQR